MSVTVFNALVVGFYLGCGAGWWFNRKPPVDKGAKIAATLVIDPKVLNQINAEMVNAWLDQNGLTWMPKGAVFDPKKVIK